MSNDKFHDECGIFGIFDHGDAAAHTVLGLHSLQHRGQEAAGIVSVEKKDKYHAHRSLGLVSDNFNSEEVIKRLKGRTAIGHNRYSTSGDSSYSNIQPLSAELDDGFLALAHNGNFTNAVSIKRELNKKGKIFYSNSDTEILLHLVAESKARNVEDKLIEALAKIEGAYSLVAMNGEKMIILRDPHGVRPLSLGRIDGKYVAASETVAFDIIGASFEREIRPGEMLIIDKSGIKSIEYCDKQPKKFCIFEYVYFLRPDSVNEGKNVYEIRKKIGMELAKQKPVSADLVVAVPDSGVPAAIGYAKQAELDYEIGVVRNHYVGRTFIEPSDSVRNLGVKLKHNANRAVIEGKRIVLVDDSIVRGTTSKKLVAMIRDAGAKEIHMRISSPPTVNSCFYGVDTPHRDKLMAAKYNIEEIRKLIGADSLDFISIDGLYKAVGEAKGRDNSSPQYCDACFTSEYPINLKDFNEAQKPNKQESAS